MMKRRLNATSEVGSNPAPTVTQEMFLTMMAEQRRDFMEMLRTFGSSNTVARQYSLPKFNAESNESDAASWCAMVDLIFAEKPLEGSALISALSSALTGDASLWLTQTCFPGISWIQFKELFLQRFGCKETSAATIMTLLNSHPRNGESIAAFGNRLVNALESKWKQKSVEEIAVTVALAHLTRIDKRLQKVACTTEIANRADLQHELKAFSYVEKGVPGEPSAKLQKFSTPIKCHFCGKEGRKMVECRLRKEQQKDNRRPFSTPTSSSTLRKTITCFKCGVAGHVASMCTKVTGGAVQEKKSRCVSHGKR